MIRATETAGTHLETRSRLSSISPRTLQDCFPPTSPSRRSTPSSSSARPSERTTQGHGGAGTAPKPFARHGSSFRMEQMWSTSRAGPSVRCR
eukprot:762469-Hanusia_phi.AAC.3